jgi:hypothetical protein
MPEEAVPNPLPPDPQVSSLLRQLDELLAEATRLRDRIDHAMTARVEAPFWPDRRRPVEGAEGRSQLRRRDDPHSV